MARTIPFVPRECHDVPSSRDYMINMKDVIIALQAYHKAGMRHGNITNVNTMAVPLPDGEPPRPDNAKYKGLLLDLDPANRYRQPGQKREPAPAAATPLAADPELD